MMSGRWESIPRCFSLKCTRNHTHIPWAEATHPVCHQAQRNRPSPSPAVKT